MMSTHWSHTLRLTAVLLLVGRASAAQDATLAMRQLQQAVGQSGLAVINVGNDAEVADELGFHTGEFTCMPLRHQDTK